jgi:murein DD-endopeptidase MepM/ murein hydrolase activator NlpD
MRRSPWSKFAVVTAISTIAFTLIAISITLMVTLSAPKPAAPSSSEITSTPVAQKLQPSALTPLQISPPTPAPLLPVILAPTSTPKPAESESGQNDGHMLIQCNTQDAWFLPLRDPNIKVTAKFGCFKADSTFFNVVEATGGITATAKGVFHPGIDLKSGRNAPVYAVGDGQVIAIRYSDQYGKHVILKIDDFEILYGHLNDIFVRLNQKVHCGEAIAITGATGKTLNGAHLHFEVRKNGRAINPMPFLIQAQQAQQAFSSTRMTGEYVAASRSSP